MKEKQRKYSSIRDMVDRRWDAQQQEIPKHVVYNHLPSVPVDATANTTTETRRQGDGLFNRISDKLGPRKVQQKKSFFHVLFHTAKRALHVGGCVRYSRKFNQAKRIHVEVVNTAVSAGCFLEHRSPSGSPKMSRLLPRHPIEDFSAQDPWTFDPNTTKQFVYLRSRNSDEEPINELEVDWSLPIAFQTQEGLELVNAVNSKWIITYTPWNYWDDDYERSRKIRPIHYAVFKQRWDWYGRLHTGKYGQQSLRKKERATIRFDGEPSVELDYSGTHPRLLYHLECLPFDRDPYALWGDKTTPPMRLMAKQLINAAINAKSRQSAIAACNQAMNTRKKNGQRKTGDALRKAQRLYNAMRESGLGFKGIYPLAEKRHRKIAKYFGTAFGMRLMRMDSILALDILYHFAKLGCPCLGVHDSFIVPVSQQTELKRIMLQFYDAHLGFLPVVK
jgi:hypothetical protein